MEVEEHDNDEPMEYQEDESMSEDDDDDDDDDSSDDYSDSEDSGYENLLHNALFPPNGGRPPPDTRTPMERWRDYLTKIRNRQTKVLKLVDAQLEGDLSVLTTFASTRSNDNDNDNEDGGEEREVWKAELLEAITTAAVNPEDSTTSGYLTHAIVGTEVLRLLGPDAQKQIFLAIASHSTLAYLELQGIQYSAHPRNANPPPLLLDDKPSVLSMAAVIEALMAHPTPALSEMELLGVKFPSIESIRLWSAALEKRRGSLRQVNIVGIEPPTTEEAAPRLITGWLDPILLALAIPSAAGDSADASNVTNATPLDELKLVMRQQSHDSKATAPMTAITPEALATLLRHKKKWWRLSLDGMGLGDAHLHVLTTMFRRDDTCKAGDLLSLECNPNISSQAYEEFFEGCFFWKRRMGLIKVDNKDWEGQFDLVRSMNNLHNRLDYVVSVRRLSSNCVTSTKPHHHLQHRSPKCSFASRDKWVDWLAKLGTGLAWEDDKHRINYLWFTLLEKPEFIYSHE